MVIKQIDPQRVRVRKRFRKDVGDINELTKSIETIGLLHPIVVDSSYRLIAGERRLRAVKKLRWKTITATIVSDLDDAVKAIQAERDENTCRKSLLPSEAVRLGLELERLERPRAKERRERTQGRPKKTGGKKPPVSKDKTRDKVGASIGMSGRTYEKAKEVIQSGDAEAIEQMDRTGKVGPAHNRVKQQAKRDAMQQKLREVEFSNEQPLWTLIHGDAIDALKRLDEQNYARLVFADPPYNIGIDYGGGKNADLLPPDQYVAFCCEWMRGCWNNLSEDGSFWLLISDEFAAELCVKAKRIGFVLRSWIKWFEGFGVNCVNNFNRTTRHLFWFVAHEKQFVFHPHEVMRPSDRQTKYNDKRANSSGKLENDLWDIPRLTGTCQERIPDFPTQLPLALLNRIVRCATDPGDLVLDPFNGSGTTGVAAVMNRRKYIGIDQSARFIELSRARLKACQ